MKKLVTATSLVLVVVFVGAVLQGCMGRSGCNTCGHSYCNPDGSVSYYRHYPGYTRECTCRTVYHPCTHYYHSHY